MSVVIYEQDPAACGWVSIGNRTWQRPDGTLYRFPPPPAREVIVSYHEAGKDEIVDLRGSR